MGTAGAVAGIAAGASAVRAASRPWTGAAHHGYRDGRPRWQVVTINRPPHEVAPDGQLPPRMTQLGDAVEVQVRPAPGDRGTELGARLRDGAPSGALGLAARLAGYDPRQVLRSALRETKQLLETGEVLRADEPRTTRRTPLNRWLELANRRAGGEGLL